MIQIKSASKNYDPATVKTRYVRACTLPKPGQEYFWSEQTKDARYDVRQGFCCREDLPLQVANEADKHKGKAFGMVDWPL